MDNLFLPSPKRAADLRCAMALSLRSSLSELLRANGASAQNEAPLVASDACVEVPSPSDFTAYFDIISFSGIDCNLAGPGAEPALARARLSLTKLTSPVQSGQSATASALPRVSTLRPPYFSDGELEALLRWWDMEPENALCLEAIEPTILAGAQELVDRALNELQNEDPDMYAEVVTIVGDIVLARSGASGRMEFSGVSSFAAWGAIGVNEAAHTHWAHYLKTIVHECAHLLLFAIAREEPLLLNDISERSASPLRADARPLDGVYHAAFVSAREALALNACLSVHETTAAIHDRPCVELLEQLLENSVLAFWACCEELEKRAQLSPLGARVLQDTQSYMREAFEVQTIA